MKSRSFLTPLRLIKAVIYVNAAMFVICLLFSGSAARFTLNPFKALTPSMNVLEFMGATGVLPIVRFKAWWTLITANWLHGSLLHIFFNMMAFRTVGALVILEYGMYRMFTIYTLAGAGGFLLSYVGKVYMTIGASSGICGLIGALLYFGKSRGGEWGSRMYRQTSGWIISLALFGFLIPNINNWGHLGGLVSGIFLGWLFAYNDRRRESPGDRILAVFLMVLTGVLLIIPVIDGIFLKLE